MTANLVVLTRSQNLLLELGRQFEGGRCVVPAETVESLRDQLRLARPAAVLVHFDRATLNGHSPGRFVAELGEAVEDAALVALIAEDCPPLLRRMGERAADETLEFPLDYGRLQRLLAPPQDLQGELDGFSRELPHQELRGQSRSLVTFTPEMFQMMEEIKVAARHNVTVLLIGETGSGKTFLARLIHELSDRRDERFCTVACGALPPDLIESELFGYVKGAFTGAERDREGKFAAAGGGTLLLDEIDVLPPDQQAKLLRIIETGEYEPVGSNETRQSQARLVVASNYNLEELVREGSFRTDLFYRLNILNFRLLPLRERPWDIEYLARKFALDYSRTHGISLRSIDPEFFDALRSYHWPGNVREMENVLRRAVLYCQRGQLTVNDLPSALRAATLAIPDDFNIGHALPAPLEDEQGFPQLPLPSSMGTRLRSRLPSSSRPQLTRAVAAMPPPSRPVYPPPLAGASVHDGSTREPGAGAATLAVAASERRATASLEARVDVLERRIIEDCLARNNFRRKETAAELGISRVTLYNKMKKFGLM